MQTSDSTVRADRSSLRKWAKQIPYSRMVYPDSTPARVKYLFWRLYTPYHPYFRDTLLTLGVIAPLKEGRQNFLLGRIARGRTIEGFVDFLISKGYANHFVAWKDKGEVVGLRRVDGFEHQYHIRLFEDGEVRGHYEYTPECYPILHYKKIGQEDCGDEFRALMGDWIVSVK